MQKSSLTNHVYNAILSRRTIRRFTQKQLSLEILKKLVNAARLAPSAANLQPLEYVIVNEKNVCSQIFEALGWAAYLTPRWTPSVEERPVAYNVIVVKDTTNKYYPRDVGFATENMVIAAEENDIGSCILCNINRDTIREIINAPKEYEVDSIIALGYKAEHPVVEELTDSVKYWRNEQGVLHVPKRNLEDIIHLNGFLER